MTRRRALLQAAARAAAHSALLAALTATGAGAAEAPAAGRAAYLGEFRVTYYYVAEEDARFARAPRSESLQDVGGRLLARVSPAFRRELDREGTGRLRDGRVLNVATRKDGRWRYVELARGSWGLGSTGAHLEPFVTVAADPELLPMGSRVLLPELAGLRLPDGRIHPGLFHVSDRGGAIRGSRLDVFLGRRASLAAAEARVASHAPTPVFLVAQLCPGEQP